MSRKIVVALLCLSGCARVSEPLPPLILIPKHTEALELRQIGDRIRLEFPRPTVNTDGSAVQTLKEIRIYRVAEDRSSAKKNADAKEFLSAAQTIAQLEAENLEAHKAGDLVHFFDDLSLMDRSVAFQRTFYYAVEFVNKKGQSDGLSNILSVEPVSIPDALTEIRISVSPESIRLEWDPPRTNVDGTSPARIAGYNIYRSFETPPRFDRPLNESPVTAPYYEDRDFTFGKDAGYAVSVVGKTSDPWAESLLSKSVLVAPRDTFPPAIPQRLEAFALAEAVILRWDANQESDLAGYLVYRSHNEAERGSRLNEKPILETGYTDRAAERQITYYYRVTAVDRLGNESQPTPPVSASLPQPSL